ncbi:MAG: sodium:phosphate symporter [Spirochaetaceae bacterium]|nr:sodium:phosphate symporter [Spirochaetaceae bacterium]|tara:strand:- start:99621 stop:101273 length:1653 start_codon:yes stop_codon:yes gene_type:complete
MEGFEFWTLLAGLGIFLFGMFTMEESIRQLAGPSFKHLIRRYTGNRIKGLITGIISTSVLQSSSAVSLMVLAFVGAGLMSLTNAIAVMVGSNIGTTFTAWIVAVFGFKIKIDAFAFPLIGLGGLGMIFLSRSPRYVNISRLLVALGLLFHGLEMMKSSVAGLSETIDLAELPYTGLWFYVLLGVALTAAMQASAATIALVLTGLHSGMIGFDDGAAMVIGANIGTTVTILLGAMGGSTPKKQAAFSHVAFNALSAGLALLLFPLLMWIILDLSGFSRNGVLGIALFHTLFNTLGAALFLPFLSSFTRLLNRIYPERRTTLSRFIANTAPDIVEAAQVAFRNEVLHQLFLSVYYICHKYSLPEDEDDLEKDYPEDSVTYGGLAELHAEIFRFYSGISVDRTEMQSLHLDGILRASRSIMNSTRNLRELLSDVQELEAEEAGIMYTAATDFKARLARLKAMTANVYMHPDRQTLIEDLNDFFAEVERNDRDFIAQLSRAVQKEGLAEEDVTRLLMTNRLFTQSCRMLVLSMKGLAQSYHDHYLAHLESLETA